MTNENPFCYPVSDHRSQTPAKGMAWVPKRGLNIKGCETARLLKLTNNSVEPLCFHVPRKAEFFQEDLYPDTQSLEPSHTADQWLAGSNKTPKLMSLNPANNAGQLPKTRPASMSVAKSAQILLQELNDANSRIKKLEERLAAAGLSID